MYLYIPKERRHIPGKLLPRSEAAFLVGYGEERNQFRFWVLEERKIRIARDFKPRSITSSQVHSDSVINLEGQEYEIYHMPPSAPKSIAPPADISDVSPSVSNHIPLSREDPEPFRPLSRAQLRIRYPTLFPESGESSNQDPTPPIIGEFPTEQLPPLFVLPSTSTQVPTHKTTVCSSTSDAETSEAEADILEPASNEPIVTRSGRTIKPPKRYGLTAEYALLMRTAHENPDEPTLQKAMNGPEKNEWDKALLKEVEAIEGYRTWEEATPPVGARFIGTKWVLRKKRDENGKLVKYKARLTAKGFAQIPGLDFDETFSAVIRTDTIRLLLAYCVQFQLNALQFDIESAYLNAPLDGEIYLTPLPMLSVSPGKVLGLRKSLYGLKQAA